MYFLINNAQKQKQFRNMTSNSFHMAKLTDQGQQSEILRRKHIFTKYTMLHLDSLTSSSWSAQLTRREIHSTDVDPEDFVSC